MLKLAESAGIISGKVADGHDVGKLRFQGRGLGRLQRGVGGGLISAVDEL
jgi:hypothetical protein